MQIEKAIKLLLEGEIAIGWWKTEEEIARRKEEMWSIAFPPKTPEEEAELQDQLQRLDQAILAKKSTMDMLEQMTLEEYKQKVRECLMKNYKHTTQENERLMTLYEEEFQEFLSGKWEPSVAAKAMVLGRGLPLF